MDWGIYTAAIRRWERLLGRKAPIPTQPGRHGRPVLAPAFSEFLMGLSPGYVSALPLPRTAQLRVLGNGVVPQQAAYAVRLLLADLAELTPTPSPGLPGTPPAIGCNARQDEQDTRCQCGRAA